MVKIYDRNGKHVGDEPPYTEEEERDLYRRVGGGPIATFRDQSCGDDGEDEANREANRERLRALCDIMAKVHALAEVAWPRDDCGMSEMPNEGLLAIMDVQGEASKALGLPEDLDLMTGDPLIDL